jgi:alanyl-tRNA synthetase
MGYEKPVVATIAKIFIKKFENIYESVEKGEEKILTELSQEELRFQTTLVKGLRELERRLEKGNLTGKDAFNLFATYGFPLEMTLEVAEEKGIHLEEAAYQEEFKRHQELSRTASAGKFKGGLADNSAKVTALHTATHLMLAALRKELGDSVHQAGSNITEERTRFDFTYDEKVPREVLDKIEDSVNQAITAKAQRNIITMDKTEARAQGVEGSFWEKYPDQVTVYEFKGEDGTVYSQELCGGPHVENTEEIIPFGKFIITKEEASSRGVRRIKAVLQG